MTIYEKICIISERIKYLDNGYSSTVEEEVKAIYGAEGPLGKCEDYLFNTVKHLDELGLSDNKLSSLAKLIKEKKHTLI